MLLVKNGRVITPIHTINSGAVLIKDDTITAVGPEATLEAPAGTPVLDAQGCYIAPGFIEAHVHGGAGGDVMAGTVESILTCGRLHARGGVTSFMPTTLTSPLTSIEQALEACEKAMSINYDGAKVLGAHLEGPYFNINQRGAQNAAYLKTPLPQDYLPLLERHKCIKKVTAAPELPGAMELGQELRARGIVAAVGHSDASYQDVVRAVENGYTHATHLFSGMSSVWREQAYRVAGVIEAVLTIDELTSELIADGHHLPPSLINMALKAKGSHQICLTTDAMAAAGQGPGKYELFGLEVVVDDEVPSVFEVPSRPGQYVAKLADRSAFAASVATMDQVVRTMVELVGLNVPAAVKMATVVPARIHHLEKERGMLSPGLKADLVIFDDHIHVQATIVEGRLVYQAN